MIQLGNKLNIEDLTKHAQKLSSLTQIMNVMQK